jgi:hypothetical protein
VFEVSCDDPNIGKLFAYFSENLNGLRKTLFCRFHPFKSPFFFLRYSVIVKSIYCAESLDESLIK